MSVHDDLARFNLASAELDPPFALVDLEAFSDNAHGLVSRAAGKPIRVASKSVRCRALQQRVLSTPGFRGTLCFTLPEALWLESKGFDDLLVAYPTVDRAALRSLVARLDERPDLRVTVMVDSVEQLDLIDSATDTRGTPIRVCLDVDAGWWVLGERVKIGAKRSPVHTPEQASALARAVVNRAGFQLVGVMAYESQIAGVGDAAPRQNLRGLAIRKMQSLSGMELADRRERVIAAIRDVTELEFVNGGGTGSVEKTAREDVITEVAAGSGLFGPTLFDNYRSFNTRPAALFVLPVVRRPSESVATVLGGGYLASGPGDESRLPSPYLPSGLRLDRQEGAGEVQTPLLGDAAGSLQVGDRVYFRHAKAGELCERFDRLFLIAGERIVDEVPTYRGEGRCFL